jgi:DNA-binding transcriptional LysR family regulator
VQGNIRANSSLDLKNLALSNLGVAYLPSFTVKQEIKEGLLKEILHAYQPPALNMYAVYPSNKFLSKKTQAFIDFLTSLKMGVVE